MTSAHPHLALTTLSQLQQTAQSGARFALHAATTSLDGAATAPAQWSAGRSWLGSGAAVLGAAAFLAVWLWHRRLASAIGHRSSGRSRLWRYPSLTVVRPVRGRDAGARRNLRAALDTGYPGLVETLFVFDDEDDPGLPLARQVVEEHQRLGRPGAVDIVVAGKPPAGRTGKLNAMIVGAERASGTLIGFGDSDTRPDREVLRAVVEALMTTPRAGAAFAPVLVDQPPRAAGDALYALMQNALYSPLAAYAAGHERLLPFIMGQLMVFKRGALEAVGGVAVAEGQLVDDMYLGRALHQAGYVNVMSRHPLHIAIGPMTTRQFLPLYRRWIACSRNGLPLSFTWRQWMTGVAFFGSLLLAVVAFSTSGLVAALPAVLTLILVGTSQLELQRSYGGAPIPLRLAWTAWGVFLLAPLVLVSNLLRREVDWRGRVYRLDDAAALAVAPRPPMGSPAARLDGAPRPHGLLPPFTGPQAA